MFDTPIKQTKESQMHLIYFFYIMFIGLATGGGEAVS